MENPFEIIIEKLDNIESQLKSMNKVDNGTLKTFEARNEILNTDEVADLLSLAKSTLYKMTSDRSIPHFKRGKKLYFKRSEVDGWLTQHRIKTNDEIERMASEYILRNPRKGRHW